MSAFDPRAVVRPGILSIAPYQPGKPVEEVERELGLGNIIKLASNENPSGPSPKVAGAINRCLADITRYPDGNGFALKAALSNHLGVEPEMITLGNGSNDVLEFLARVFASDGDEIIFSQHAFAVYPLATLAVGAKPVVTPAKDWGYDLQAISDAITEKTRLIFIANPNNPTGTWNRADELEAMLKRIPSRVIVVIDEAYCEYVPEQAYESFVNRLHKFANLVVTRTFSKIYGLAGLRVGYCVSSGEIADLLNRIRQPFNVNSLALAAALTALEDQDYVDKSRELNTNGLHQLCKGFDELRLDYIPSIGNFVSVDVGGDAQAVYESMLKQGVIVRPVAGYEMPNHLRITTGLPEENERALDALRNSLTV